MLAILLQVLLVPASVIPVIMDTYSSCELLAAYIGVVLVFEILIVFACRTFAVYSIFNFYLYVQIICGLLKKATLFGLAVFCGIGIRSRNLVGLIIGSIGLICILVEQVVVWS